MATFNNRRTLVTKAKLKDALIMLMERKSLEDITVKELCLNAGINRSTFYLHYTCPEDLLKAIEEAMLEGARRFMESRPEEDSEQKIAEFLRYLKTDERAYRVVFRSDYLQFTTDFFNQALSFLPRLFENRASELDSMRYVYASSGGIGIISEWFRNGFKPDESTLAHFIYEASLKVLGDTIPGNPF